jgi:hypothetical protein
VRLAAFAAGSFVAIGLYLFVASVLSLSGAAIGLGVLVIAVGSSVAAAVATPSASAA